MVASTEERLFGETIVLQGAAMGVSRTSSSIYLACGYALSMGIAVLALSGNEARAQADLNLQTQVDIITAPFSLRQPQTVNTTPQVEVRKVEGGTVPVNRTEAKKVFRSAIQKFNSARNIKASAAKELKDADACVKSASTVRVCMEKFKDHLTEAELESISKVVPAALPPGRPTFVISNKIPEKQGTNVKFTFPFNPTYETNVFKSNTNVHPDTSAGFGAGWQVTTGVDGRPFDIIALSMGSASSRYNAFPSQSADVLTIQGFYQYFLGASRGDGTPIIFPPAGATVPAGTIPPGGMITVDTVAIGIQNQTAFVPTYLHEKADFFTPQVTFARQNINLSGPNSEGCVDAKLENPAFCYFATLLLTPAQTFSDVATLANANLAASATIGTRINQTNLTAALATTVTGKAFEYVPGGRQDLLIQIGPTLAYTANKCINGTLAVTYNRNYSTLTPAAWSGWVVQPTLNIVFPVQPPPDKGKGICDL
jgi:hypothetical protein